MFYDSDFVKIRTAVPLAAAERVRNALSAAGAGHQGNYEFCSGSFRQIGRFRPLPGANPSIGTVGKIEEIEEEVIEVLCHKELLESALIAVRKVHPYEEPSIDILPRLEVQ